MQAVNNVVLNITSVISFIMRNVLLMVLWSSIVSFHGEKIIPFKKRLKGIDSDFVIPFTIILLSELIVWTLPDIQFPIWIVIIGVVMIGYAFYRDRESMPGTVFAFTLYVNFRSMNYFVIDSVMKIAMKPLFKGVHKVQNPEQYIETGVSIFQIVTYILYVLVLFVEVIIFRKIIKSKARINWIECGYLSVLNVAECFLTSIMMRIAVMKIGDELFVLTDIRPGLLWQMPMVSMLIYLGEMAVVYAWQEYSKYRRQSEAYMAEAMEKDAIKRRLEDTERYYEDVRRTRHEMASHMTAIKGLATNGNLDELNEYIERLDNNVRTINPGVSTGNPVTDVVIGDRMRKAQEAGITFTANFLYSSDWKIPVYDLSIVISNLLDNAIRAAVVLPDGKRYIFLQAVERNSVVLLICKNAYDPIIRQEKRPDEDWHGFGLKNVREIAERYGGGLQLQKDEKEFTAMVMMKK